MLRDVSLRVEAGEVVCLLGANGAGKTTLIRTILGLVRATRGEIRLGGQSLVGLKPHQVHALGVGVVPEGKRLFPRMTVLENLRMGAFLVRDEAEIQRRLAEVMALFPRLRERAGQLAGLMSRPRLLIMDEPSFGLAPALVQETFRMVCRISATGTTVLLVEQNALGSLQVAHRGYVLQKGEIVHTGTGGELLRSPHVQKAYLLHG